MGTFVSILSLSSRARRNSIAAAVAVSTRKLPFCALSVVWELQLHMLAPWLCCRVQAPFLYRSYVAVIGKFSFSGMLIISNVFQHEAQGMKSRNQQTKLFPAPRKKSLKCCPRRGKPVGLQVLHQVVSASGEILHEEYSCELLRKSVNICLLWCSGHMLEKWWTEFTSFLIPILEFPSRDHKLLPA